MRVKNVIGSRWSGSIAVVEANVETRLGDFVVSARFRCTDHSSFPGDKVEIGGQEFDHPRHFVQRDRTDITLERMIVSRGDREQSWEYGADALTSQMHKLGKMMLRASAMYGLDDQFFFAMEEE